MRVSYVANLF